jgi:hypothetical protein
LSETDGFNRTGHARKEEIGNRSCAPVPF